MNKPTTLVIIGMLLSITSIAQSFTAGRMKEVFMESTIVSNYQNPWEITMGPDDSLWVTESNPKGTLGYRVKRIHPVTKVATEMLNLLTFTDPNTPGNTTKWQRKFTAETAPATSFQGGLMGLAIHPEYKTNPNKRFVYIAYGHEWVGSSGVVYNGETVKGNLFLTYLVRFTESNGSLINPVALCDTIRGSNDHNSGRIIIRPENGVNYLYYALGDLGAGQFANLLRTNKAQVTNSYEGKILRFNLEEDSDPVQSGTQYDRFIPNDNPFNVSGVQSAVWAKGIRNNQGFAYDTINGYPRMYGSSHGPFSDDEINLLEKGKNYGHPEIIGYSWDGNYNNAKAGPSGSSLPLITSESARAASMPDYKDPVFTLYPAPGGDPASPAATPWSVQYIYTNQAYTGGPNNGNAQDKNEYWHSEGYASLGLYTNSKIPGWKNSLMGTALKWGRVTRMKLNNDGTAVVPTGGLDTITYFQSKNRFRDLEIDKGGTVIYVAFEQSTNSSGPSANNPVVPNCAGCIQKYEFLGYNDSSGYSLLRQYVPIAQGRAGVCENTNKITLTTTNNLSTIWVPITDTNSNIVAEIRADGNLLGDVSASIYKNGSGTVREDGNKRLYLDRNLTITTANNTTGGSGNINLRMYITSAELNSLKTAQNSAGQTSGVTSIDDIKIFRSKDACRSSIYYGATNVAITKRDAFGADGYFITAAFPINSTTTKTSSFYIGGAGSISLPTSLISFSGQLGTNKVDLFWKSSSEINAESYVIERSSDGSAFAPIGSQKATGASGVETKYNFADRDITNQPSLVLYYRLKMIDIDGEFTYSNTILVSLSSVTGKMSVTPNPVTDIASVSATAVAEGSATWKLVDNAGRVVLEGRLDLRKGNNFFPIGMKKLAAGLYVLQISGNGIQQQTKIQKL